MVKQRERVRESKREREGEGGWGREMRNEYAHQARAESVYQVLIIVPSCSSCVLGGVE